MLGFVANFYVEANKCISFSVY